ncbi:MAG: c-type cytochrome biogenesis protein CcsB [Deltaproteobacteria bacterium]|nr:c-type cytochrome biogenesis protein CcsB [Deltaproteobacteria bacterium]
MVLQIAAAVYAVSTVIYVVYLVTHGKRLAAAGSYALLTALAVHTTAILARWIAGERFPLTNLHESLSFFAWFSALSCAYLFLRYKMPVLGAFIAPFALFLTLAASTLPSDIAPLAPVLNTHWLKAHIAVAVIGNAFFGLACLFGVMYLIQDKYLKSRKIGGMYFVLPSLETLDELNYRCLTYGFPLLTLGIVSGALWSEHVYGSYWIWKHRQVWSLITWLMYAVLLHGRLTANWRGRKAAAFSVIAFCVLFATSLIIYTLLGEGHGLLKMGQP